MRPPDLEAYHRPATLDEAVGLLAQEGARPLGGGTRRAASAACGARLLVDLTGLGLDAIEGATIGATVPVQTLCQGTGCLAQAARRTSFSRAKRSQATVAGEVAAAGPDGFLACLLLASGATFEVAGESQPVGLPGFWERPGGRLVTGIRLVPGGRAGLEELAVVPTATPLVVVAGRLDEGRLRLAVGGGLDHPVAVDVEGVDPAACADAAASVYAPPDRPWASAGYAIEMARVLARRLATRLVAGEGDDLVALLPRVEGTSPGGGSVVRSGDRVRLEVDGRIVERAVEPSTSLLELLRAAGARGVKHGCETGECGACTIRLDGECRVSCLTLAGAAAGRRVTTIESLGAPESLHPLQSAFVEEGAIQCGYCTPGMILAAQELLERDPDPDEPAIREALAGVLCRCTGYVKPVRAVQAAARRMNEEVEHA